MERIRITQIEVLPNYRIRSTFSDGRTGIVSFQEDVEQGVFKPLSDPSLFAKARIEQFGIVLTWDIDVPELERPDACADWMYQLIESTT